MWLVAGLGNPGNQYKNTRHNIGFMVVDAWLKSLGSSLDYREEHKSETKRMKLTLPDKSGADLTLEILVAKPHTFMNKSGEAIQALMNFYKIPKENLLVIHDDIDQNYNAIKFQKNRGHGGQNGVRNISEMLGTSDYARLKMGVGRPAHPGFDIGDYVLSAFSKEEVVSLAGFLERACDGIECFLFKGMDMASTQFNGLPKT